MILKVYVKSATTCGVLNGSLRKDERLQNKRYSRCLNVFRLASAAANKSRTHRASPSRPIIICSLFLRLDDAFPCVVIALFSQADL